MKKIILLVLVGVMIYVAGCAAVESPYNSARSSVANINKQAGVCDEKSQWKDNWFVVCPETTTSTIGIVTPTQAGK